MASSGATPSEPILVLLADRRQLALCLQSLRTARARREAARMPAMPTARSALCAVPSHVLNGVGVALGVTLVYFGGQLLGGHPAALAGSSGAVYASLADVPNPPGRTWVRVLTAALIGTAVSLLVGALRDERMALGAAIAAIAFFSNMALAWGPRAGPVSFVGIMTFVFTMAAPAPRSAAALLAFGLFILCGGLAYLGWSVLVAAIAAPRYRALALANVLSTLAQLLRARAAALTEGAGGAAPWRDWIGLDSLLDERLQAARDQLFAARETPSARCQTSLLLLAIDLREKVLLNQLDLDLLGEDAAAQAVRAALAQHYEAIAAALGPLEQAVRGARALAPPAPACAAIEALRRDPRYDAAQARWRLLPVLADRLRHMGEDLGRMYEVLASGRPGPLLSHEELQLFVTVEGWPLAALRPHARLRSSVLRHALRASAALTVAYYIGLALPWSSHPHWLVLSVAVVLRGSLEQTMARRNLRLAGTVVGCLIVLAIANLATPWLSTAVYLAATGLAHAYSVARYFVTATAATVMALLQDHLANPGRGFAVAERLADTAIGALLAWAFSYVLPSWERHNLPRLLVRLTRALERLADQAVRLPGDAANDLALRLARREVYDALRALAAAAQRSRAEPRSVRLATRAYATVLSHSHALLAHLAAVRLLLSRRGTQMDRAATESALAAARGRIQALLQAGAGLAPGGAGAGAGEEAPPVPEDLPARDALPWLLRRLQLAALEAERAAAAARQLRALARGAA
jgi:uncharacterized membrane protein YccC